MITDAETLAAVASRGAMKVGGSYLVVEAHRSFAGRCAWTDGAFATLEVVAVHSGAGLAIGEQRSVELNKVRFMEVA